MTLILGVAVFTATNIDDIFVLLGFFADPRYKVRHVVFGQCIGIGVLVLVSVVAARIALVIPPAYVGLLGIIPVAIGIKQLIESWRNEKARDEDRSDAAAGSSRRSVLAVATITIANGGDNIGVYTPLFAVRSVMDTLVIVAVFAVMTVLWCAAARWLVHHPTIGAPIRRYAHRSLPFVLIALGIFIMAEAGTFDLLRNQE